MKRLIAIALILTLACTAAMGQNFALPRPPAELRHPQLRAGWLLEHFWDNAVIEELSDGEMEQSFVTYISLFPIAQNDSLCNEAVAKLMTRVAGLKRTDGTQTSETLASLAQKYLFEAESPMLNEEYFAFFLPWCPDSRYFERIILNNRLGTQVEEFSFEKLDRETVDFSQIEGERILLLYEIGCSDCMQMIEKLRSVTDKTIVAIAVNAKRQQFRDFAPTLPSSWICGFDSMHTINGQAFAIRKLPDVYLISPEGIVLGKHLKDF